MQRRFPLRLGSILADFICQHGGNIGSSLSFFFFLFFFFFFFGQIPTSDLPSRGSMTPWQKSAVMGISLARALGPIKISAGGSKRKSYTEERALPVKKHSSQLLSLSLHFFKPQGTRWRHVHVSIIFLMCTPAAGPARFPTSRIFRTEGEN